MKKFLFVALLLSFFAAHSKTMEGLLSLDFGDGKPPNAAYHIDYLLITEQQTIPLLVSEAFKKSMPIMAWNGSKVRVQFKENQVDSNGLNPVQAIELLAGEATRGGGVTGPQPWVSILCKFSDVADEPEDLAYFQGMYANLPAGVDHYWREVSYDTINVVGSLAIDWVDLPKTHTEYAPDPGNGSDADLSLLFNVCTTAADPFVNFATGASGSSFVGINMMFNELLDCCAWGGGRFATLDGLQKVWRTTWNPPWSFANEGVIAHEMGHGFGLPHANNSDGDSSPYDSPWDVMSSATGDSVNDPVYGRLGKHINMEFKHNLGWVDDSDGYVANTQSDELVFVRFTTVQNTDVDKFIRIPLSDGTHYVVEARKTTGNYESNLPGTAVIIHHVNRCRSEPPWVVDADNPPADFADTEGVMWKTGETFVDFVDDYQVQVLGEFNNGFNVRVKYGNELIKRNSFESTCIN